MTMIKPPQADGLYDPRYEHDACGVAMVAKLDDQPAHDVIVRALEALDNLEHRGAEGADALTGDGAGIVTQIPDAFFRAVCPFELPPAGQYGVGVCFLPRDESLRRKLEELLELNVRVEGQRVLGWRDVPIDEAHVGATANRSRPHIRQLFVGAGANGSWAEDQDAFERKLYVIRRIVELAAGPDFYSPSFSSRTCIYKGMLISRQVAGFYPDLQDERFTSSLALVHSRFSTNTFPSWELAHPFRVIAHNGEINTLMGNVNWMRARESQLASELFGRDLQKILPIVRPGGSDSASFDNVLELLMLAGRSLPHAAMMMIPEAYRDRDDLSDELKGFYAFHACLMEPWDGPAAVCFTNGRVVGATLDRNGLRPGRWVETKDGYVILGSEAGMLGIRPENVERLGRLQPGKIFLVDLDQGRIVEDEEVKREVSSQQPYADWVRDSSVHFSDLEPAHITTTGLLPGHLRRLAFGYSQEDLRVLIAPMAKAGEEPIGSMGNDGALAVLSDRQPPLFNYFKQLFAQVTNPPIDPIRESIVMSLATGVGSECNLLDETPQHAHQLVMDQPILRNDELETLRHVSSDIFRAHTIDITWPVEDGPAGMTGRLADVCDEAHDAVTAGVNVLILSDRRTGPGRAPIPSLLAVVGRPPPPRPARQPAERGPRPGVRRAARGAPLRHADRLRRQRGQPLPAVRHRRRARRRGANPRDRRRRRREAEHRQGARQGPAEDDLQDGDLDRSSPTAARRSSRRSAWSACSSTGTSPAPPHGSAASVPTCSPRRRWGATPAPGAHRSSRPTRCCRSAASTPGAARASTTCGTRRRSRSSSTRCAFPAARATRPSTAPAPRRPGATPGRSTRSTRASSTTTRRAARRCAACCASARDTEPVPIDEVEPAERDRAALRHRRDVARLDLDGVPRDARDRDEPPRRALEHG